MADIQGVITGGWGALVVFLLGYGVKALENWLQHSRTRQREREAREDARRAQRREARITFQRQTLLDLQDALQKLARAAGAAHTERILAQSAGEAWRGDVSDTVDEAGRVARMRTAMLIVRVRDQEVRDRATDVTLFASGCDIATSRADSERALGGMGDAFATVNARIGEVLRTLDDEEAEAT